MMQHWFNRMRQWLERLSEAMDPPPPHQLMERRLRHLEQILAHGQADVANGTTHPDRKGPLS